MLPNPWTWWKCHLICDVYLFFAHFVLRTLLKSKSDQTWPQEAVVGQRLTSRASVCFRIKTYELFSIVFYDFSFSYVDSFVFISDISSSAASLLIPYAELGDPLL